MVSPWLAFLERLAAAASDSSAARTDDIQGKRILEREKVGRDTNTPKKDWREWIK